MDFWQIVILLAGGVFGGIAASLAGGAAVFTFPALLGAGLSPVAAVGTNMLALMPGVFLAALYDRKQLPRDRTFLWVLLTSLIGTGIGASLLLLTPGRVFEWLVPILLAFATVLFGCAENISHWLSRRAAQKTATTNNATPWRQAIAPTLPVTIYGGYFGAGIGILILGALAFAVRGDYRSANATKNLLTSLNSVIAITLFATHGTIAWQAGLIMMLGGLVGGNIGARIAMVAPKRLMRILVVAMGVVLTILFAKRYWF